jgi:quinol monooxygenase YgiN
MTFRNEACDEFLAIFHKYKLQIRNAEGCTHLVLLRENAGGSVFFTYSKWEDPGWLEVYRKSSTFAEVWPQTKKLFAAPAEAWTVDELVTM